MLKEFRPTVLFLVRFTALYLALNLIYGLWVTSYRPQPDPATTAVTVLAGKILEVAGWDVSVANHPTSPRTYISIEDRRIVSVYEGCNAINVEIVFLTFLLAFGPWNKRLVKFIIAGVFLVYAANLMRIVLLFVVTIRLPDYFYFVHKYVFTASIYVLVFALWLWWVAMLARKQ